ncbi:MAG TPA: flagellar hook capping protein [Firmicutes bacterium]|jgi:flagellar basal-body rod modification protein FlgD|nr:flagellar hook capping protein [Bacillota bacterium]
MSAISQVAAYNSRNEVYQDPATLRKDDFLTLLITQLRHQDPIEPMKDQEFATQLAQFSSLEAIQHLSGRFDRFMELQLYAAALGQLNQAAGLIGKTVELAGETGTITGQVSAVRLVDGAVTLVLDGNTYDISLLQEVRL